MEVDFLSRNITIFISMLIISIMLASCSRDKQYKEEIEVQLNQIHELQLEIADYNANNNLLTEQLNTQQITITDNARQISQLTEQLNRSNATVSELDKAIEEFPWLKKFDVNANTKWDKIVIYRTNDETTTKTIKDPLFIDSLSSMLTLNDISKVSYSNGYQSDIDTYTYELYEGAQKYLIKVVDRGVIEAGRDQLYFEVDQYIHQLGDALLPNHSVISYSNLISKMAASGAVKRGDKYVFLSAFRVQLRIEALANGTLLKQKPEEIGNLSEHYTFYYYGDELYMDVYSNLVHLTGDGSDEWYSLENAAIIINNEPG